MPANKGDTLARNRFTGMARSHEEQTAQPTEESYNGETIPPRPRKPRSPSRPIRAKPHVGLHCQLVSRKQADNAAAHNY